MVKEDKVTETGSKGEKNRIEVGDLVKVKTGRICRGFSKFKGPYRVREKHRFHVVLENEQRWNLRRVALYEKGERNVSQECVKSSGYMYPDELEGNHH